LKLLFEINIVVLTFDFDLTINTSTYSSAGLLAQEGDGCVVEGVGEGVAGAGVGVGGVSSQSRHAGLGLGPVPVRDADLQPALTQAVLNLLNED
jgi:hypothetical protein